MKRTYFAILAGAIAIGSLWCFSQADDRTFQLVKHLDIFNAVYKELEMCYVDTLDTKAMIEAGIEAMLEQTDPYTAYYPEEDHTLKEMTSGKFGGIGALIRYYPKRKHIVVAEPTEGNPADMAGLKAGDIIMEVNGIDMSLGDRKPQDLTTFVTNNLRGDPGTTCLIKIERPNADSTYTPMEVKVTRATIQTKPIPYYGLVNDSTGIIVMTTFAVEGCSKELKKAFIALKQQGAKAMILDLRGNGGGLLSEAVNVVNLFVPKGNEIVVTKGKVQKANFKYVTQNEPTDLDIPLAVLINGTTASASEIVSGALQDLDRAIIVGSRSYGKGLVQTPRELPYNSSMKITTSKYYIPSGRCIQAIDYSKHSVDGDAQRIPDSLTTIFHTRAGREVRDGGGIRPDIAIGERRMPNILYYLLNEDQIFDYATYYCTQNGDISQPDQFHLTDDDYADFRNLLKERHFSYDRQTELNLKKLKEIAQFEGYLENASEEFDALEKKLQHNLDLELDKFKPQIMQSMEDEIVRRYHYERGTILYSLQGDTIVDKAVEALANRAQYTQILQGPQTNQ